VVVSILKNINIAFVKLDRWNQNGFMILKNEFFFTFKENVSIGEQVIVQIAKEQISKKGPTVTRNINIENEYVRVLLHNEKHLSIEQELNIGNTKYFKTIGILTKPNNIGLDIKKKTNEISLWELINYLKEIDIKVKSIKNKIKKKTTIPCLITSRQEIIDVILRKNLIHNDTTIIVKSKNQALDVRRKIISKSNNKKKIYIEYCRKKTFRNFQYYLEHFIKKGLESKIEFSTGAHIIIEKTEALTSIDVNSGSFSKISSSRETILWINLAATKEIIYQLQLKNISGIIVIDFIGMINQDDQLSLLEYLDAQIQSNLDGSQIIQISEIGLVEITRKREERNIYDMFSKKCVKCGGSGHIIKKRSTNRLSTYFLETTALFG
jgi:ribonuclease E